VQTVPMVTLLYTDPRFVEHDTRPGHPERAERMGAVERGVARSKVAEDLVRMSPRPATVDELAVVHDRSYLAALERFCASGGGQLDPDTVAAEVSWDIACLAAGAGLDAIERLRAGEADSAFLAVRPPGHHATPSRAMGFCLLNNVAIGARHALDQWDAGRVLIFDWDVHHGNGTNDIFHSSREVLFVSIHQSPLYPGTGPLADAGSGEGEGYTLNLPVPPGSGEATWLALVDHVVAPVARAFEPALVLVSAGFDAHRDDPLAQCRLGTESYGRMAAKVRDLAHELDVPFGATLEGGYDLGALTSSVAATLEAFANGAQAPDYGADELTRRYVRHAAQWWPVGVA